MFLLLNFVKFYAYFMLIFMLILKLMPPTRFRQVGTGSTEDTEEEKSLKIVCLDHSRGEQVHWSQEIMSVMIRYKRKVQRFSCLQAWREVQENFARLSVNAVRLQMIALFDPFLFTFYTVSQLPGYSWNL